LSWEPSSGPTVDEQSVAVLPDLRFKILNRCPRPRPVTTNAHRMVEIRKFWSFDLQRFSYRFLSECDYADFDHDVGHAIASTPSDSTAIALCAM